MRRVTITVLLVAACGSAATPGGTTPPSAPANLGAASATPTSSTHIATVAPTATPAPGVSDQPPASAGPEAFEASYCAVDKGWVALLESVIEIEDPATILSGRARTLRVQAETDLQELQDDLSNLPAIAGGDRRR